MSKEKQIEEMADIVCNSCVINDGHCGFINKSKRCPTVLGDAEVLYNAGYRKQSEGEWIARDCITKSKRGRTIHYFTAKCSVCGKGNGRHKTRFCPNCGAKMKGGAE